VIGAGALVARRKLERQALRQALGARGEHGARARGEPEVGLRVERGVVLLARQLGARRAGESAGIAIVPSLEVHADDEIVRAAEEDERRFTVLDVVVEQRKRGCQLDFTPGFEPAQTASFNGGSNLIQAGQSS